jgi:hypothetical protein
MRRACATVLPAVLLAACTGGGGGPPPSTINISDSGVFLPSLRASIPFGRGMRAAPSVMQAGQAMELGLSRADGEDSQTLNPGAGPVRMGGATFNAPQQLRTEFDFTYIEASYRWRYFQDNGPVGLELRGGLALVDLSISVSSASQRASESLDAVGIALGGGLVARVTPQLGAHGRITIFDSGGGDDVGSATRVELFGTYALNGNVALRAGYVSWKMDSDRNGSTSLSPVKVRFSGPMAGLDVMF